MRLFDPKEIHFAACQHAAFMEDIDKMRRSKAETVKHSHWFTLDPNPRTGKAYKFACSNCERVVFTHRQESVNELGYAFCPHCGAFMYGDDNDDETEDEYDDIG